VKKHKSVKRESRGDKQRESGNNEVGSKQVSLNPVQMAQFLKGHVSQGSSREKEREREPEKPRRHKPQLDRSKDRKQQVPRFAANASSEEDDYNFLSDEGEMEKETITTHLKNN